MDNTPVELLLEKYLSGTLAETERQLLHTLLQDPAQRDRIAAIIDREMREHAFEATEDDQLLTLIQKNIKEKIRHPAQRDRSAFFTFRRVSIAAALVMAVLAAWWWTPRQAKQETVQQTAAPIDNDVQPGGQKAVLKLADGTEITLNNADKGTLAHQGEVKVIKQGDGSISYDPAQQATKEILYNTITTPRGGQYQLLLADGSKVWLNAASSLRYPVSFTGHQRKVELTGEGYFEIAHNTAMPFYVTVNGIEVQVLGTHFNINAYVDEPAIRTTLLQGSVKVVNRQSSNAVQPQSVILTPGQQATVSTTASEALQIGVLAANIEEVMAWKNGLFYFKSADLSTILRQAARWYDVDIENEEMIDQRFSGQISRNVNASQLLQILELTGKVRFGITGRKIKVKSP
jgi:ferric-dicitrate binding protein FerR (iron transport regulator)